jgi:hypothetical protein
MKRAFFAIIALAVVGCSGAEKEKKTNEFLWQKKKKENNEFHKNRFEIWLIKLKNKIFDPNKEYHINVKYNSYHW